MEATVQQFPLFAHAPQPSPADVDVAAVSRPAREFTGDFYFTHRHGPYLWVVLGDVAGKGLKAAVVMAMIQEELEENIVSCADAECDPAVMMQRLHLFLRDVLPRNRFATAVIAQIHDDGRLTVVNAGHPPVFVARRDGSVESIGSSGPVIGLLPVAEWRAIEIPFRHGDTLLAYSDGVMEARSKSDDELGLCRLQTAFAEAAKTYGSSGEVAESIQELLEAHDGGSRYDDATIVVARR
jgi:sigma-B regulation protein RsbU (phosphoserine phosphatase)